MKILKILIFVTIFGLGFFASSIYALITENANVQIPLSETINTDNQINKLQSPNDWLKEEQIKVFKSQIILDLKDAEWATFADTKSMEPVLSSKANAIEIVPKTPDQIKVGDIVSYESEYADGFIIHRVIEKGMDENGEYFILKGDNNKFSDPGKVRFSQIRRVVVAIIY